MDKALKRNLQSQPKTSSTPEKTDQLKISEEETEPEGEELDDTIDE